jgi:hypothetical protein
VADWTMGFDEMGWDRMRWGEMRWDGEIEHFSHIHIHPYFIHISYIIYHISIIFLQPCGISQSGWLRETDIQDHIFGKGGLVRWWRMTSGAFLIPWVVTDHIYIYVYMWKGQSPDHTGSSNWESS